MPAHLTLTQNNEERSGLTIVCVHQKYAGNNEHSIRLYGSPSMSAVYITYILDLSTKNSS